MVNPLPGAVLAPTVPRCFTTAGATRLATSLPGGGVMNASMGVTCSASDAMTVSPCTCGCATPCILRCEGHREVSASNVRRRSRGMGSYVVTRGLARDMCAPGVVATCEPCAGWPAGVRKSTSSPVAAATSARVGYNAYGLTGKHAVSDDLRSGGTQVHALGLIQQRGSLLLLTQVAQLLEGTPGRGSGVELSVSSGRAWSWATRTRTHQHSGSDIRALEKCVTASGRRLPLRQMEPRRK